MNPLAAAVLLFEGMLAKRLRRGIPFLRLFNLNE